MNHNVVVKTTKLTKTAYKPLKTWLVMVSKWCLSFTSSYVFGEDKKLYRLPYTSGKKEISYREIKKQYPNRYRINNEWWSEKQLKKHLILDQVPYLIKTN